MTDFTLAQQAKHCRQLADFLEKLPSKKYWHTVFSMEDEKCGTLACALGWAAHKGIGGLEEPGDPYLKGVADNPQDAGDVVFGEGSYDEIFDTYRPPRQPGESRSPRIVSIQRLRERAKRLTKQARSKA